MSKAEEDTKIGRIDEIQREIKRLERQKEEVYREWERNRPRNPAAGEAPDLGFIDQQIERLEREKSSLE